MANINVCILSAMGASVVKDSLRAEKITGADPGFKKGGDVEGSRARPQDFFSTFRPVYGHFQILWHKKGWACAPPLNPCLG